MIYSGSFFYCGEMHLRKFTTSAFCNCNAVALSTFVSLCNRHHHLQKSASCKSGTPSPLNTTPRPHCSGNQHWELSVGSCNVLQGQPCCSVCQTLLPSQGRIKARTCIPFFAYPFSSWTRGSFARVGCCERGCTDDCLQSFTLFSYLCIFPCNSINFSFMFFEALLFDA